MKRFKYRAVVVKLGERGIEGDKKCVIDAWMADVVADGGDKKGKGIGRGDERCKR